MAWLILLFYIVLSIAKAAEGQMLAKHGCQAKCGAVDIPYPFGIGPNCSFSKGFEIACNMTGERMVPFHGDVEVLSIMPTKAQARLYNSISWQCYDPPTDNTTWSLWNFNLIGTIYTLSSLDNIFIVMGCETLAFNIMWEIDNKRKYPYRTGCVSTCYNKESLINGSCSGNGCCQTSIPSGINYYNITFDRNYHSTQNWDGHCSYAVIMETTSFNFSTSYITTTDFWWAHNGTVPVVLDWSIGNETCKAAYSNMSNYACVSNNSECIDSANGSGYICNCSTGYQGNPYLQDGCQGQIRSLKFTSFVFNLWPIFVTAIFAR
jgi:Wall-associated receptor kinase galacturonan-binding